MSTPPPLYCVSHASKRKRTCATDSPGDGDVIAHALQNHMYVLMHGPGGCGKSYAIMQYVEACTDRGSIAVITPTGISAVALLTMNDVMREVNMGDGVRTLHAWLACGPLHEDTQARDIVKRLKRKKPIYARVMAARVIVIDEISMVSAHTLDIMSEVLSIVHKNSNPMGGVRCVMSGDFMQLPPVRGRFAFTSRTFTVMQPHVLTMLTPYRFTDATFHMLLLRVRMGNASPSDLALLKTRVGVKPTKAILCVFPRRSEVDHMNTDMIRKCGNIPATYAAAWVTRRQPTRDAPGPDTDIPSPYTIGSEWTRVRPTHSVAHLGDTLSKFKRNAYLECISTAPATVTLARGVTVMVRRNIPEQDLYNGTMGSVVDMDGDTVTIDIGQHDRHAVVVQRFHYVVATVDYVMRYDQLPVVPCAAATIHKCQGITLDGIKAGIGASVFCGGQAYVAMSRCRTLRGLHLTKLDKNALYPDKEAAAYVETIETQL